MEKKQPQPTVFSDSYGTAVCPACGSMDVQLLKGKIKARELPEILVRVASIAVGLIVLPLLVFILGTVLFDIFYYETSLDYDIYDMVEAIVNFLPIVAIFVGPWLGIRFSREWIRRRRSRSHKAVEEYLCNTAASSFCPAMQNN